MNRYLGFSIACLIAAAVSGAAVAGQYQLLTGVDPGVTPGPIRNVFSLAGVPGDFTDGDRLAGTLSPTESAAWQGNGAPMFASNGFGSLSFMFRRGSLGLAPGVQLPIMAIDYLGGPLLDLDGDLGNGVRKLTPDFDGQGQLIPAAIIPNTTSHIDLSFGAGNVSLNNFDVTATNSGSSGLDPSFGVTVNTMAGTQPDTSQTGPINPGIDTRHGTLAPFAPGVTRITNLGYEFWQDSIGPSSTAGTLGTLQYLGDLDGYLIERDGGGNFPTLAGLGLGTTLWPAVDVSEIGNAFNKSGGGMATILDGVSGDPFSAPGNGGLPLTEFGGDLGAYLDSVVVPNVDALSQRFIYLESAGFGMNNSFDPIFGNTNAYDVVLIAQSTPVPEPGTMSLLFVTGVALVGNRRRRAVRWSVAPSVAADTGRPRRDGGKTSMWVQP